MSIITSDQDYLIGSDKNEYIHASRNLDPDQQHVDLVFRCLGLVHHLYKGLFQPLERQRLNQHRLSGRDQEPLNQKSPMN